MIALAKAFLRDFPENRAGIETLEALAIFCGVGLIVSLLLAMNGLDVSMACN